MKKVLFTRKLSIREILWCLFNGIIPIIKAMIRIESLKLSGEDKRLLASTNINYYIFTSKNAVKFFLRYKFFNYSSVKIQHVEFITIGFKTARLLRRFENKIHIYQHNSQQSFELYVENLTMGEKYLYFCSDLAAVKWKEYPILEKGHIIEIYRTRPTSKKVEKSNLKRIVFMSSSAVNSFFQKNSNLPDCAVCYVIGEPTFNTLKQYFFGKIVKPDEHSFQSIIKLIKS